MEVFRRAEGESEGSRQQLVALRCRQDKTGRVWPVRLDATVSHSHRKHAETGSFVPFQGS